MLNINIKYSAMAVNLAGVLFIIILGILTPFVLFNVIMLLFVYIIRYKVNRIIIPNITESDNDKLTKERQLLMFNEKISLGAETKMLVNKKSYDILMYGLIVVFGLLFYLFTLILHELAHLFAIYAIDLQDNFSFSILTGIALFVFGDYNNIIINLNLPTEALMLLLSIVIFYNVVFIYLIGIRSGSVHHE